MVYKLKGDTKNLHKLVKSLTGVKNENRLPDDVSDSELTERFASFFTGKIEKIRTNLDQFDLYDPPVTEVHQPLHELYPYDTAEVKHQIMKLKNKSCKLDIIPTKFIREHIDKSIGVLTKIVNKSFEEAKFSKHWKTAILRPLLKKVNLDLIDSNYRPVTNLSFISKLVEHAALDRLVFHMEFNNITLEL